MAEEDVVPVPPVMNAESRLKAIRHMTGALERYMDHETDCQIRVIGGECSCGLLATLTKFYQLLKT